MTQGLNGITHEFLTGFHHFAITLTGYAMHLAYLLAGITLTITVMLMVLQGDDLNKVFAKLIQSCLLFGLFFGLISLCGTWIPDILNSFMQIGGKASGIAGLSPNSVFSVGADISLTLLSSSMHVAFFHLATALILIVCAFFVLIIYAFLAAEIAINLVKAYALVAVGPIIFALGNSDFTRSCVTNYLQKVIGMGINLMMLYVIIGIGKTMGEQWLAYFKNASMNDDLIMSGVIPVVGGLIVLYLIMKNIPAFIAEISGAGGFRNYGDAAIAAAVAGSAALAKTVSGGGQMVGRAAQIAYRGGAAGGAGAMQAYQASKSAGMIGQSSSWSAGQVGASDSGKTSSMFANAAEKLKNVGSGGLGAGKGVGGLAGQHAKAGLNSVRGYLNGTKVK